MGNVLHAAAPPKTCKVSSCKGSDKILLMNYTNVYINDCNLPLWGKSTRVGFGPTLGSMKQDRGNVKIEFTER
jgi:hypothetical protein